MIEAILWVLFVLACIVVSAVILLQEGKGGGLSEAFGGAGQQTFGVKAEGINKFTGYAALAVVILAIAITRARMGNTLVSFAPPPAAPGDASTSAPAAPGTPAAPAQPAGEQPAGGGGK
jgi:preprotein translocase subunit SecG